MLFHSLDQRKKGKKERPCVRGRVFPMPLVRPITWPELTLYTLTSVSIFSILFSIRLL